MILKKISRRQKSMQNYPAFKETNLLDVNQRLIQDTQIFKEVIFGCFILGILILHISSLPAIGYLLLSAKLIIHLHRFI